MELRFLPSAIVLLEEIDHGYTDWYVVVWKHSLYCYVGLSVSPIPIPVTIYESISFAS